MSKKQQGKEDKDTLVVDIMQIFFVGIIVLFIIWAAIGPKVAEKWRRFELGQTAAIAWCIDTPICGWMPSVNGHQEKAVEKAHGYLEKVDAKQITGNWALNVSKASGKYIRFFLAPIVLFMFIHLLTKDGNKKIWFKNFDAYLSFARTELSKMKWGKFIADMPDRSNKPIWEGEDSAPLWPLLFAEKNGLIVKRDKDSATIDYAKAKDVFAKQLGERYTNASDLILKWKHGWVVKELLDATPASEREHSLKWATQGHLYNATVVLNLLRGARRFGVVEMARFHRLSKTDRALHSAMSSVGRGVHGVAYTVFSEGAGIMAQWDYELAVRALKDGTEPEEARIEQAVEGLQKALNEEAMDAPWSRSGAQKWENF